MPKENLQTNPQRLLVESPDGVQFLEKLSPQDRANIKKIQSLVESYCQLMFATREEGSLVEIDSWAWSREGSQVEISNDDRDSSISLLDQLPINFGVPFFALYVIGGSARDKKDTKDIDLLLATNTGFPMSLNLLEGMGEKSIETNLKSIFDQVQMRPNLVDEYGFELWKKNILTLSCSNGRPIDLTIVSSCPSHGFFEPGDARDPGVFTSRAEFEAQDTIEAINRELDPTRIMLCCYEKPVKPLTRFDAFDEWDD